MWSETILHPRDQEQVEVVRSVTMEAREGEIFALLGPTGAGKTTLLRMIAGTLPPDEGGITIAGFDISESPVEIRRRVATITGDERSLYPELSVLENMQLFATFRPSAEEWGDGGADAIRPTNEVLQVVGLREQADARVASLTSALKQRLLIARSLLSRPSVLLLDDPDRALDPRSAALFGDFLRNELVRRERYTVILACQDPQEALQCDRVGIMDRGRILLIDTPAELRQKVGNDKYRIWVRETGLDTMMTLTEHPDIGGLHSMASGASDWTQLEVEIPGGLDAASRVLSSLIAADMMIARFERVALSLPQLLERVGTSSRAGDPGWGELLSATRDSGFTHPPSS